MHCAVALLLPPPRAMAVFAWRARSQNRQPRPNASGARTPCVPGAYAGRARFRPIHHNRLPPILHQAIGRIVEFGFAGVAPASDPFAGQPLYLEWCRDDVFDGFMIPEQDLEFLKGPSDPNE